jgi:dihydrolipoamide dehydrogenase
LRQIQCDVAIIGAGTTGLSARAAAADAGAKVVMIESGPGGTTCARVGCMPSKLLIAAGRAAHAIRGASVFGIEAAAPRIDGAAVMARVQRERDGFVGSVLDDVAALPEDETIQGRARFIGPTELAVDDHTRVEARAIVIATGSSPTIPPELAGVADKALTNETVFELKTLPRSLAVIGAGPLGIELAQAFARLGVRVVVLDKAKAVAGLHDPKVGEVARQILAAELDLNLGVTFEASAGTDGIALRWSGDDGQSGAETFDYVLAAAGRPPNLDGLDLDRAGIALDDKGTPVFDRQTLRCGDSAIFIAGDADHDRPVLHEAANEGRIAGVNAGHFPNVVPGARNVPFSVVYTDPQIAAVGVAMSGSADQAIGERDLRKSGRARVEGRNAGLIRLYARRDDNLLLGGEMVGPDAEHLAHLLAWAIEHKLKAQDLIALPFYHPTIEESLRSAARNLCHDIQSGGVRAASLKFGPGA